MERNGKCMINDVALTTFREESCAPGVTLGSYQTWGEKRAWVKYEAGRVNLRTLLWIRSLSSSLFA